MLDASKNHVTILKNSPYFCEEDFDQPEEQKVANENPFKKENENIREMVQK